MYGPLPTGLTLLEASAGTGKTFAIATLAARYLAEGTPVEELLVVTFTRAATGELRDRVRERLVLAERGLRRLLDHWPPDLERKQGGQDELVSVLARGPREEVAARVDRLATALADFDAGTITTTHGFCQHILWGLGTAGDVGRGVQFLEDCSDLVEQVVGDLYVRKFAGRREPSLTLASALEIGRAAVDNPDAVIEPRSAPDDPGAAMRVRLAGAVRREVVRRKLRTGTLGYDDLLTRLAETLRSDRGPQACERLRERYKVVLVDEFQDTDPLQWEILQRSFGQPGTTLVLIGDPKQAIYSFRGADVWAYLEAAGAATDRATLGINWRADQGLVEATDALLGGAALGHPDIRCHPVQAAPVHRRPGIQGAAGPQPLRVRVLYRSTPGVELTGKRFVAKAAGRRAVAADLAGDVVALLSSGARVADAGCRRGRPAWRPLDPSQLAVLVQTNPEGALIRDALEAAGVPAVVNGAGNVLDTPVARSWLTLLSALERPSHQGRARSAALTPFLGWSSSHLAGATRADLDGLQATMHRWANVLSRAGVAGLVGEVTVTEGLAARLLAAPGGDRQLTDLGHVGQLLHAEAITRQLGVTALTDWLRRRIAEAPRDKGTEERSRRLDSDGEAVQVLTVHRSKGLEFPVVYLPFLWAGGHTRRDPIPLYHDPARGAGRALDVGGAGGPGNGAHKLLYRDEMQGEGLRLAYVALTRARHQVVTWWVGSEDASQSPLGNLLLGRRPDGTVTRPRATPDDDAVVARLQEVASRAPGQISVETAGTWAGASWAPPPARPAKLAVATFDRPLDTEWRRTSYTAMTAGGLDHRTAHGALVASEPEDPGLVDEPAVTGSPSDPRVLPPAAPAGPGKPALRSPAAQPGVGEMELRSVASPMAHVGRGPAFGTMVHAVLERADFDAHDLGRELSKTIGEVGGPHAAAGSHGPGLVAALQAALETPLGPLAADIALRDVGRRDRLDEVPFELPLARERDTGAAGGSRVPVGAGGRRATGAGEPAGGGEAAGTGEPAPGGEATGAGGPAGGGEPTGAGEPAPGGEAIDGVTLAAVARCLRTYLSPGDPLAGYPDRLAGPALAGRFRGYLTGTIDLVLRTHGAGSGGGARYLVVDYKTNWLGPEGEDLSVWHYRPAALTRAMEEAHYPLQALLYSVGLHRYLRWRLPGYSPDDHLGGVLYLFLRGMAGAGTPRVGPEPSGVFAWKPPPGLVPALSDLLDRGQEAAT